MDYATTFGPAVPNRDYTPVSGTLTFPANVTEQSFTVQTIDDAKFQGERGVLVELSNPTGGLAMGLPPMARVNILDNELYYPPLLDDFETYPYLWSVDTPAGCLVQPGDSRPAMHWRCLARAPTSTCSRSARSALSSDRGVALRPCSPRPRTRLAEPSRSARTGALASA